MFNRQIEITRENESLLFINAVIENLRYGIISLDMMFNGDEENLYQNHYDEHTFYFFHMQSVLDKIRLPCRKTLVGTAV